MNALNALLVLGLAWWPRARALLGRAFLPVEIGLLSALPILANHLLAPRLPLGPGPGGGGGDGSAGGGPFAPPGPTTSAEGMALRLLPVLFMALVLTAWQYRWPQVVLFSLGTASLTLGLLLFASGPDGLTLGLLLAPDGPPPGLFAGVLVAVVQTFSFLAVGYFISSLMGRLRAQQAELAQAN